MRSATLPKPSVLAKSLVSLALAAACLWAIDAGARNGHGQHGGNRPGAGAPSGQWQGRHVGGGHGRWHGHGHRWHGHGHRWHGHGGYWYPFAWGVGAGVALTYPWWGWGYPYGYYYPYSYPYPYYGYERPVGVVIEERPVTATPLPPPSDATSAFRWYCPSPAGYHPEIAECTQAWLRVLPPDAQTPSPPVR